MNKIKWLLPLVALIITATGIMAMTQKNTAVKSPATTTFYWYEYDPSTNQLGALLNPNSSVKILKEDVPTDCQDDLGQPECVRAYNENNRAGEINPPAPLDKILRTAE